MTKYKFSYVDLPDSLKLNSDDFELADANHARAILRQTQKQNCRVRHGDELPVNEAAEELDEIKMNSAPARTKSEAKTKLRRTQRILSKKVSR